MRPNPSDPERTVSVAIVATRLRSERLGELRPEPRPRRIGETRIDSRSHSRIGVARKRGSLRQREPGRERDRNERMAEVVHADPLAAVSVQPRGVTSRVDRPEHVATAVRPSTRGREHERVRPDAEEPVTSSPIPMGQGCTCVQRASGQRLVVGGLFMRVRGVRCVRGRGQQNHTAGETGTRLRLPGPMALTGHRSAGLPDD